MRYSLVLFDFDGTLADSADWFLEQLNLAADEMGFRRIDPADYENARGYSSQEIIKYLGLPKWKLPILLARMRKAAAQHRGEIKLFGGVGKMLAELKRAGIQTGIVSSNAETNIREILGEKNCGLIGLYACGASLFGKATKLRGVLRRGRFQAKEAIYIGDEIRDAVAAREVRMDFGAVAWGFTTAEALRKQKPELEFNSVDEIAEQLVGSAKR